MAGKYFIIITFVVLAIPTFLFGQQFTEVTVYGVVTDSLSGQPLAKVLIEVINEADSSERASALTDGDGKYRVRLLTKSKLTQDESQLPEKFGLMQNFPNPFNPSTMIQFQIPYTSDTRIIIYNTLGQKIRTLVNRQLARDTYTIEWDGSNDAGSGVAAGIYFYQLRTSDYLETRKMIMLDGHINGSFSPSEAVIHRQGESDKMAGLWVTLRASSPYIQTRERQQIAISSLMVEQKLCVKCLTGLFNQECISVSELIHNSQVYIGGLPGAVTKEIDSSVTATIINQRTGRKDTARVNLNGSFSLIRAEALEGDSISLMLYEEGQPVSGPEPLIIPETTQPKVMDSKPTNGDKDIIIDAVITVYFSEPIETATVNNNSFYLTDSLGNQVPGTIGFMEGNTIAYLDPSDSLEYESVYTIAVTTDVEDLQGLHLVNVYMATFSTGSPTSQGVIINVPGDVPTIQAGIDSASDGNIVLVENGTYLENINFKGKAITVASHFEVDGDTSHISNTIIDGSQPSNPDSGSVVYFVSGEDTTSILRGFTITGGTGTKWGTNQHTGGGILLWSGGKVESNKIINNHLTNTGGTYTHGAGMELATEGNAVVRNNLIAHNSIDAWWGGGAGVVLGCTDTALILFNKNILANNIYNADGGLCSGGAYIWGGTEWHGRIVIRNNLIMRNQAISTVANNGLAGGLYIESASPEIFNNIIAENNTSGRGGGIFVGTDASGSPGNPIIINNTIINNNAVTGGGIYNWWSTNNPLVMNTILWGNTASQQGNEIYRQAGNITVVYSDIAGGYTGEGNISKEPMLQGENYGLSDSSSCIGAGIDQYTSGSTTYYCPGVCFLGNQRPNPAGSNPDIGACESPLHSPLVNLGPIPPVVVYSKPTNGDEEVGVDVVIQVYFSEPIDTFSVNDNSFYLTDSLGVQIPGTIGFLDGYTVSVLDPNQPLTYSTSYTINVTTDVSDLQGLHLENAYTAIFNTEGIPGGDWIIYNTSTSGLLSDDITSIAIDSNNIGWIGTFSNGSNGGVAKFDGTSWTIFDNIFNVIYPDTIWAVAVDKNNNVWSGSPDDGVAKFDGTNWTIFNTTNSGLPINRIRSIASDINNAIWIGTGYNNTLYGGMAEFDGTNWTVYNSSNSGLPYTGINSIAFDSNNHKWIGTGHGLVKYDGGSWIVYNTSNSGLPDDRINSVSIDGNNHKWIGTVGGVAKFDGINWTVYNASNSGLPDNWVSSIAIDRNEKKWIGTNNGLAKYDGSNWTVYNTSNSGLPHDEVTAIAIDQNNNIWIGTTWHGLAVYNEEGVTLP